MSRRPGHQLVADILDRIERIEHYIVGYDRVAFLADLKTSDSVVRNLEVIGEAANRLPATFRERCPEIPWARVVGLRNRIVHAYFDVDLELVWKIVQAELPSLKAQLRSLSPEPLGEDPSP